MAAGIALAPDDSDMPVHLLTDIDQDAGHQRGLRAELCGVTDRLGMYRDMTPDGRYLVAKACTKNDPQQSGHGGCPLRCSFVQCGCACPCPLVFL